MTLEEKIVETFHESKEMLMDVVEKHRPERTWRHFDIPYQSFDIAFDMARYDYEEERFVSIQYPVHKDDNDVEFRTVEL